MTGDGGFGLTSLLLRVEGCRGLFPLDSLWKSSAKSMSLSSTFAMREPPPLPPPRPGMFIFVRSGGTERGLFKMFCAAVAKPRVDDLNCRGSCARPLSLSAAPGPRTGDANERGGKGGASLPLVTRKE